MDDTQERERLKASLRNTLKLMEQMGSDRHMLLDVMQEVVNEERARAVEASGVRPSVGASNRMTPLASDTKSGERAEARTTKRKKVRR